MTLCQGRAAGCAEKGGKILQRKHSWHLDWGVQEFWHQLKLAELVRFLKNWGTLLALWSTILFTLFRNSLAKYSPDKETPKNIHMLLRSPTAPSYSPTSSIKNWIVKPLWDVRFTLETEGPRFMFIFWIVFLIRLLIRFHNHLFHSILLQICVEFQNLHCPSIWLIPQIPPFRFRVEFALLEKDSGTNLYFFGWFPAFYWRNSTYHCGFHCKWKC